MKYLPLPTPHAGQAQLLALAGRYRVAVCGRRFGKTVAGGLTAVEVCEKAKSAKLIWWLTPTLAQSLRTERQLARWLKRQTPAEAKKWKHLKSEHAIEHRPTGSRIEFHTAALPDNLRGEGLDLVIIDEAADVEKYVWTHVIRPMLIDRQGEALFLGTPRGQRNYLHELFLKGQDNERSGNQWASIQLPTSANPLIPQVEIDQFKADMTDEVFRQEFLAEFVDGINAVFKNVRECICNYKLIDKPRKTARHVTGVDLGVKKNWTVITTIDTFSKRVVSFQRFQKTNYKTLVARVVEHAKTFPGELYVDSTGMGDPIFEEIHRNIRNATPIRFDEKSREYLIYRLALALARQTITYPHIPEMVRELENFIFREDQYGNFRPSAPPGGFDDCVFSLALAVMALAYGGTGASLDAFRRGIFA